MKTSLELFNVLQHLIGLPLSNYTLCVQFSCHMRNKIQEALVRFGEIRFTTKRDRAIYIKVVVISFSVVR